MDLEKWANENLIHMIKAGSHLYGTSRPDSDVDYRGICLMPRESLLGWTRFDQYQKLDENNDLVIYGLTKFFMLAKNCNPNILDILFAPVDSWEIKCNPEWLKVYSNRYSFLSQRLRYTFSGYAVSQLKRIKGHRKWLTNPPTHKPEPEEFRGKIETGKKGQQTLVFPNQHFEQQYKVASKAWKDYQRWLKDRNPARARLESQFGYDSKHACHLVRLMIQAENILNSCDYNPTLSGKDLKTILEVLAGKWGYGFLVDWAEEKDKKIKAMATALPRKSAKILEWVLMEINKGSL